LKLLDKYIIKKFLGTFFLALALFVLIAIVFDISEKIDEFIEKSAPLKEIFLDYYLNFTIHYANLFSSLIVFISVIFFTSRLAFNSEFIAIINSGVSFFRLMFPYFIAATIITSMSIYLANNLIPTTNKARIDFEYNYLKQKPKSRFSNLHRQILPNHYIFFKTYNTNRNIGYHFSYEVFDGPQLKSKLNADYLRWDTTKNKWILENYLIRNFINDKEFLLKGNRLDTTLAMTPKDLSNLVYSVESMKLQELNKFIKTEKARGSDTVKYFEIEKHQRFSYPFATYILTLIAVSLSARKPRGGIGINIAAGIGIAFAYILFMKVAVTFAINGNLLPAMAVWVPNIIFGIVALGLYKNAPK